MSIPNRPKESVEDKLVEHIKSDTLMRAIADEDTLTELAERAVKEAFFKEEIVASDGYGRPSKTIPALPVVAAKAVAEGLAQKVVIEFMENDEEFRKVVKEAFYEMLPQLMTQAIVNYANGMISSLQYNAGQELENTIRDKLLNSGLTPNF